MPPTRPFPLSVYTCIKHNYMYITLTIINRSFMQMCFIFEAILVAARIDVYGIFYAIILGLMLLVPRTLLPPVWVLFLILHGLSLMLQYVFLMGLPPSLICRVDGEYCCDLLNEVCTYVPCVQSVILEGSCCSVTDSNGALSM